MVKGVERFSLEGAKSCALVNRGAPAGIGRAIAAALRPADAELIVADIDLAAATEGPRRAGAARRLRLDRDRRPGR